MELILFWFALKDMTRNCMYSTIFYSRKCSSVHSAHVAWLPYA